MVTTFIFILIAIHIFGTLYLFNTCSRIAPRFGADSGFELACVWAMYSILEIILLVMLL